LLRHGLSEKILVCMPTYHSKIEWIERSINSLKSQTYKNFDCFIVKDGCRDACDLKNCLECKNCDQTINFCRDISKKDNRFNFFILPNHCSGAGWGPRNFAIMNTNHNLIAYLDDDNWYEPDHLESLYNLISDNNVDVAYTGTRLFDAHYNKICERIHPKIPKAGYIDTSEIMHKRYLINKYGGWRYVPKCNDWDIVSRWVPNITWAHTNKITLNFYVREGCGIHRR
jgi:glycosyltransferase involved in cell wall biosynthesis